MSGPEAFQQSFHENPTESEQKHGDSTTGPCRQLARREGVLSFLADLRLKY